MNKMLRGGLGVMGGGGWGGDTGPFDEKLDCYNKYYVKLSAE